MLDHIGIEVSDYPASKAFYEKALEPLGITFLMEPAPGHGGFGSDTDIGPKPYFWIFSREGTVSRSGHVAFEAKDRATVDAFHAAALAAGGVENGPAGMREHYHPNYYGAFVLDPDGNNVEAVSHRPE